MIMAALKISLKTVDVGLATGQPSYIIRIATWDLDGIIQNDGILNLPNGTTDVSAAQSMRNHLTAYGKTWTSELPVNVIS